MISGRFGESDSFGERSSDVNDLLEPKRSDSLSSRTKRIIYGRRETRSGDLSGIKVECARIAPQNRLSAPQQNVCHAAIAARAEDLSANLFRH